MVLTLLAFSANAVTFTADGLCYQTASGGVNVIKQSSGLDNYAGLTNVVIPSVVGYNGHNYKVVRVSDQAFRYAQDLESIEIPNSVTMIGASAIFSCPNLKSVKISSSVKTIGSSNLKECPLLEEIWVDPENTVYDSRDNCNALIKTSTNELLIGCNTSFIPGTVESIADYAFFKINGVKNITLPPSVTSVGYQAFAYCYGIEHLSIEGPLSSLGVSAFDCCVSLLDVQLCEGIETISRSCFQDCNSLASINLPQSLTAIDSCAFMNCKSLASIELGENIKMIGANAFRYCISLKEIKIPDSVEKLGNNAFFDCYGLFDAYVGQNITTIGNWVFMGCSNLSKLTVMCKNADNITGNASVDRLYLGEQVESIKGLNISPSIVRCYGSVPPVCDENTFTNYYGRLYVPQGSLKAYATAPYWENFGDVADVAPQIAGDVNGDYATTAADVTALYDILLGNDDVFAQNADVNGDGVVTAADVTAIYEILLGAGNDVTIIFCPGDRVVFKSLTTGASSSFFNETGYSPFDIFRLKGQNYFLSQVINNRAELYTFGEYGFTLSRMLGYELVDCSVNSEAYSILAFDDNHYYTITCDGNITSRQIVDFFPNSFDTPVKSCLSEDGSIYVAYNKWVYPTSTQSYVCRDGEMLYELNIGSIYLTKMLELDGDIYVLSIDSRYWKNGEEHSVDGMTGIRDAKLIDGTLCLVGGFADETTSKAVAKIGDVLYDFSYVSTHPTVATCCEVIDGDLYTLVHDYEIDEEYSGNTWLFKNDQLIFTVKNNMASKFIVQRP